MAAVSRVVLARSYAAYVAERARSEPTWWTLAQRAAQATSSSEAPQYLFHQALKAATFDFCRTWGLPPEQLVLDGGGETRGDAKRRNYQLFGAVAHPDAAVLRPFRCAIEYDVQPRGAMAWSGFKQRIGKPVLHVLSGAYDAVLHVYVLSTDEQRVEDFPGPDHGSRTPDNAHSYTAAEQLAALGVYLAVLPGYGESHRTVHTKPL